jgi:sugar phosphate isomerase/epimerase
MKLGAFTVLFNKMNFDCMLDYVKEKGIGAVEIGTGGYPGNAHCNLEELLADNKKLQAFSNAVTDRDMIISAFSCHGNPLSPDLDFAKESQRVFLDTVILAEKLGVPVVNCFSGVPGDHENAKYPNWPVVPWPLDYQEVYQWQWEQKIIPYWREAGSFAKKHNVKIALELHGGFSVHTPATLLRLREAVGEVIGANLDPSHLWWQGIDPVAAIKILGKEDAIFHFHAKDTAIDQDHVNMYGLTDMQPFQHLQTRAWQFRTVGFGHSMKTWTDILSALRQVGYDYVVSIEHEDAFFSIEEGFIKASNNLQQIIPREPIPEIWWG